MNNTYIIHGETKFPYIAGETNIEDAKNSLAAFYPELRNATDYTDSEGNIRFRVVAGSKG